jgi:hypothetical protein
MNAQSDSLSHLGQWDRLAATETDDMPLFVFPISYPSPRASPPQTYNALYLTSVLTLQQAASSS